MGFASRDPRPLSEIAVPDEAFLSEVAQIVEDYLIENPPVGGLTINQIKADSDIADALSKKHASGSDNQDLSGKMDTSAFSGLTKITVSTGQPSNPSTGDLWIDIS